jgi:hypothetical protein
MGWFMEHQRPDAWNHWAEVVYRDPLAARFIGDMPHTWVGSDFIRSVLDMFVYDEQDVLHVAAGMAPKWIDNAADTVIVSGLRTPYGPIAYRVFTDGDNVHFRFDDIPIPPKNGFIVHSVHENRPVRAARADGSNVLHTTSDVRLPSLPRELVLSY